VVPDLVAALPQIIDAILNTLVENIPGLLEAAITLFTAIVDAIPLIVPVIVDALPQIIESILTFVLDNIPTLLEAAVELFLAIVEAIPQFLPDLIGALPEILDTIITAVVDAAPDLLASALDLFAMIVEGIVETIPDVISACGEMIAAIVENLVEKAKSIMNFEWSLPKLKLPRIHISGDFGLNPLRVPHFSIEWYAKGGVFDEPTLFPFGDGQLGGLGEDGAEAIVPLEKNTQWLDRIAEKLNEKQGSQPIVLQVDGKTFAQISVDSINQLTRQRGSLALNLV